MYRRSSSRSSPYENRGEERLYYVLEHASRSASLRAPVPRTKVRGNSQRARIGLRRAATATAFQSELLTSYASSQDAWRLLRWVGEVAVRVVVGEAEDVISRVRACCPVRGIHRSARTQAYECA